MVARINKAAASNAALDSNAAPPLRRSGASGRALRLRRAYAGSDVDLLVILPHRQGTRPSLEIRRRISAGFPVDILVRAPTEIARRLREGDSFIKEIMSKGRVLYEASHS